MVKYLIIIGRLNRKDNSFIVLQMIFTLEVSKIC